jgi:hypothetical protein
MFTKSVIAKIPKVCLEEIQRMHMNITKKYHAVGWEMITKPKELGGLGLRRLDIMNQACLLKLGWKFFLGANDLWFEVL